MAIVKYRVCVLVTPLYHRTTIDYDRGMGDDAAVGGNSLEVALIDNESVAIVRLWLQSTPTIGVNSFGLFFFRSSRL